MKDVVFIDDITNSESDLELRPSGRNNPPMVVGVAEPFKLPLFDLDKNIEEQVKNNLIAFQKERGGSTSKGCSLTLLPCNNYIEGMQPIFGIDGE